MKKIFIIIISVSLIFILNTCALEIANVIGPDGGYVFYDKGSYSDGWRYILCSSYDFGELKFDWTDAGEKKANIEEALRLCSENTADWHKFGWEIPTEAHLRKMLECFSYGLTRFSPDYYYLSVNDLYKKTPGYWICDNSNHSSEKVKNTREYCSVCGTAKQANQEFIAQVNAPPDPNQLEADSNWKPVIFHKNFNDALNGEVEKVNNVASPDKIRLRAIRRF